MKSARRVGPEHRPIDAEPDARRAADADDAAAMIRARSVGSIMSLKFRSNRLAVTALWCLIALYFFTLLSEFFAPYTLLETAKGLENHPPTPLSFIDGQGRFHLRPFVNGYTRTVDRENFRIHWERNREEVHPIRLLVRGQQDYRLLGFLPVRGRTHLFGVEEGHVFLFGTDKWGRDVFSRILYGGRISLTIGWAGVLISLFLGVIIGTVSGYFSGVVDHVVQRVIEVLMSVPVAPAVVVAVGRLAQGVDADSDLFRPCRHPVVPGVDEPCARGARHDPLPPELSVRPGGAERRRWPAADHGVPPRSEHQQLSARQSGRLPSRG